MNRSFSPHAGARLFLAGLFFVLLVSARPAGGLTYDIQDLGTLGGVNSRACDVNASGWVVGEAETAEGLLHAFLWTPTNGMTDIGSLGGEISRAYAINDRDLVVGEAETEDGRMLAFKWTFQNGLTNLPLPGEIRESYAYGNNNYGVIAGAGDVGEGTRAILWSVDGPVTPEKLESHGYGIARDVNDFGDVVGQAETGEEGAFVSRAFYLGARGWRADPGLSTGDFSSALLVINADGVSAGFAEREDATHAIVLDPTNGWRDIDTLDSVYSVAYGINREGRAVGLFVASHEDEDRAFVTDDGQMLDLNELVESEEPWLLVEARAINDAGQIAGYGLRNGRERAFLLTPRKGPPGPPVRVAITRPSGKARFKEGGQAELEAGITGMKQVHRVTFFANGTVLGSATGTPYRLTWKNLEAGSYDLVVAAVDWQGRVRRSPRVRMEVELEGSAQPAVVIVEPDDGTALAAGSNILIQAEVHAEEGGEDSSLSLWINGQQEAAGTGVCVALDWRAPTTGLYVVNAVLRDGCGAGMTSAPVHINVSEP